MTTTQQDAQVERPYPELLSDDESKVLLKCAEQMWRDLQANNLGGFSGINRPFWILHEFRRVIEEFGHRDTGLHWSKDQLDAAALSTASVPPQAVDTGEEVARLREALKRCERRAEMQVECCSQRTDGRGLNDARAIHTVIQGIVRAALEPQAKDV